MTKQVNRKRYYANPERVSKARIKSGMTMKELAEKSEVSVTSVTFLETEPYRGFNRSTIVKVARGLGLKDEQLFLKKGEIPVVLESRKVPVSERNTARLLGKDYATVKAFIDPILEGHKYCSVTYVAELWEDEFGQGWSYSGIYGTIRRLGWIKRNNQWIRESREQYISNT